MAYPEPAAAVPARKENYLLQIGILVVLLLALLGVLIYFRAVPCNSVHPVVCDVYYSLVAGGKPKVLIVHGESGMGNPEHLYDVLKSPHFSARVALKDMQVVSLPVLMESQIVIVERARVMGIEDLKMFEDYVNRGGKLVWIGDAGTVAPDTESDLNYFLKYSERKSGGSPDYIGPWARKVGNKQLSFDYLLGVDYLADYCDTVKCSGDGSLVGHLDISGTDKELVNGISQALPFYGNFSIVKQNDSAYQSALAYLDYGENLIGTPSSENFWLKTERQGFGRTLPLIVSSGFGGRVAYYAFPPEYVVSEKMPIDKKTGERVAYWGIVENMYYGMLYK
ncbi:MAG TPA: hypothetical protein VJH23_06610 [archaeon]|nr:hypothetical protein [archaeon]